MSAALSSEQASALAFAPRPRPHTLETAWQRQTEAGRAILTALLKCGQVATTSELMEVVDLPDLDRHIEELGRYVQSVRVSKSDRQSGVALTTSGLTLAQWGCLRG